MPGANRQRSGAKGGRATVARHGPEHMRQIGRKGFAATVARHWQGDRQAYVSHLRTLGMVLAIDRAADREIDKQINDGAPIWCVEVCDLDDGDESDLPF